MRNPFSPPNACAKFSLAAALFACSLTTPADWDAKLYNPKKYQRDDDIVLPMPCGGRMVFRKVETEAESVLGDQEVRLGDPHSEKGYMENAIKIPIAGAFPGTKQRTRYFLLGKYELTQLQYQSVMSPTCPAVTDEGNLPMAKMTWFNAVDFANQYSLWLLKNAPEKLPGEGDAKGFVRLPTEAEWEFAARGGLAKFNSAEFEQNVPDNLNEYAWYSGSDSANTGKARGIGLLSPNPLGLHDMLGNVDEIVLEPFRLTSYARLHGQAGAYTVRGGSFLTTAGQMRFSYRQEVPFYNKSSEPQTKITTGVRLAVAGPALNEKILKELAAQWPSLQIKEKTTDTQITPKAENATPVPKPDTIPPDPRIAVLEAQLQQCTSSLGQAQKPLIAASSCPELMPDLSWQSKPDPEAELLDLAAQANQPTLASRLDRLRVDLKAIIDQRNRQRGDAAREALRSAGMICLKLHDDHAQVVKPFAAIYAAKQCESNPANSGCPNLKVKLDRFNGKIQFNRDVYVDTIIKLSQNYPMGVLESQKNFLLEELKRKGSGDFTLFVDQVYNHAKHFQEDGKPSMDDWYEACKKLEMK